VIGDLGLGRFRMPGKRLSLAERKVIENCVVAGMR
jgi:hypothetical protein